MVKKWSFSRILDFSVKSRNSRKNHSPPFLNQKIPYSASLLRLANSITSLNHSLHFALLVPFRKELSLSCDECSKSIFSIIKYSHYTATTRQSILIISTGISIITLKKNTSSSPHFTFLRFFLQEFSDKNSPLFITHHCHKILPIKLYSTSMVKALIDIPLVSPNKNTFPIPYFTSSWFSFHEFPPPDSPPKNSNYANSSNNLYSRSTTTAPIACVFTSTIFNPSAGKLYYYHSCPFPEIQEYTLSCDECFKPFPYPTKYSQHTALSRKSVSQDIGVCSLAWSETLLSRRSTMSAPHLLSLSPRRRSSQGKCLIYLWPDTVLNHVSTHKSVLSITLSLELISPVAVALTYFSYTQINFYTALLRDTPSAWTMICLHLMSSNPVYVTLMLPHTTHTPESFLSLLYDIGQPVYLWTVANNRTTSVSSIFLNVMVISLCLGLWTPASAVQFHRSVLQTSTRADPPLHPTRPAHLSWSVVDMDTQNLIYQIPTAGIVAQPLPSPPSASTHVGHN